MSDTNVIYVIAKAYDNEGYDLPEEYFLNYEDAVVKLNKIAQKMRKEISKGNIIYLGNGSIEIYTLRLADNLMAKAGAADNKNNF